MNSKRITASYMVDNRMVNRYSDGTIVVDEELINAVQRELDRRVCSELPSNIEEGKTYVIQMRRITNRREYIESATEFRRELELSKLILCKDCGHTPPVDEALIKAGKVDRTWCRIYGSAVSVYDFCSKAVERKDYIEFDLPAFESQGEGE